MVSMIVRELTVHCSCAECAVTMATMGVWGGEGAPGAVVKTTPTLHSLAWGGGRLITGRRTRAS